MQRVAFHMMWKAAKKKKTYNETDYIGAEKHRS